MIYLFVLFIDGIANGTSFYQGLNMFCLTFRYQIKPIYVFM